MTTGEHHHEFDKRLAEAWPVRGWCDSHVLVGVSGGPDSVALLRGLYSLKAAAGGAGKLYVAHLNHQMRGTASDDDAAWVGSLCERVGIPLVTERADIARISEEDGDGWEAAARCARYSFFRRAAEELGARYVAVGHTADDQVETVMHRIIRGTGIEGLSGMRRIRPLCKSIVLVRPLLSFRRSEICQYLTAVGQDFRVDASNEDVQFTRNRLRRDLLPKLRATYNERIDEAILRLASQAADTRDFVAELGNRLADECVTASRDALRIDCNHLAAEHRAIIREVFRIAWARANWQEQAMSFEKWEQLASAVGPDYSGRFTLPGHIQVIRDGSSLMLKR